jgi:hypothetical protein
VLDEKCCIQNASRSFFRHSKSIVTRPLAAHLQVPALSPNLQGRTQMTVLPTRRSVELKVATASSRAEIFPRSVCSRPSRTRWTISLSWA